MLDKSCPDDVLVALEGLKGKIVLGDKVLRAEHRAKRIPHTQCGSHDGFWAMIAMCWLGGALLLFPVCEPISTHAGKVYGIALVMLTCIVIIVGVMISRRSAACTKCVEASITAENFKRSKMFAHYDVVCRAIFRNWTELARREHGASVYKIAQDVLRTELHGSGEVNARDPYFSAMEQVVWDIFGFIVKHESDFSLYHSRVPGPLVGDMMWDMASSGLIYGARVA